MINNIPVRFYTYSDDDHDVIEVSEDEFMSTAGEIGYERFTIFANGVSQICLTKMPRG